MRRMILVALSMCLGLAACGGDQPDEKAKATQTDEAAEQENFIAPPVTLPGKVENHGTADQSFQGPNVSLDMEIDNFYFEPTFVRTSPGATVSVELTNEGTVEHSFSVDTPAIEEIFRPGDTRTVEIKLPESGMVSFYCKFHRSQGMQGAFYFKAGGAA
jgi:plastocyanin